MISMKIKLSPLWCTFQFSWHILMLRVEINALNFFQKLSSELKSMHCFLYHFITRFLPYRYQLVFINPGLSYGLIKVIVQVIKLDPLVEYAFDFVNVSKKVCFSPRELHQAIHYPRELLVCSTKCVDLHHA